MAGLPRSEEYPNSRSNKNNELRSTELRQGETRETWLGFKNHVNQLGEINARLGEMPVQTQPNRGSRRPMPSRVTSNGISHIATPSRVCSEFGPRDNSRVTVNARAATEPGPSFTRNTLLSMGREEVTATEAEIREQFEKDMDAHHKENLLTQMGAMGPETNNGSAIVATEDPREERSSIRWERPFCGLRKETVAAEPIFRLPANTREANALRRLTGIPPQISPGNTELQGIAANNLGTGTMARGSRLTAEQRASGISFVRIGRNPFLEEEEDSAEKDIVAMSMGQDSFRTSEDPEVPSPGTKNLENNRRSIGNSHTNRMGRTGSVRSSMAVDNPNTSNQLDSRTTLLDGVSQGLPTRTLDELVRGLNSATPAVREYFDPSGNRTAGRSQQGRNMRNQQTQNGRFAPSVLNGSLLLQNLNSITESEGELGNNGTTPRNGAENGLVGVPNEQRIRLVSTESQAQVVPTPTTQIREAPTKLQVGRHHQEEKHGSCAQTCNGHEEEQSYRAARLPLLEEETEDLEQEVARLDTYNKKLREEGFARAAAAAERKAKTTTTIQKINSFKSYQDQSEQTITLADDDFKTPEALSREESTDITEEKKRTERGFRDNRGEERSPRQLVQSPQREWARDCDNQKDGSLIDHSKISNIPEIGKETEWGRQFIRPANNSGQPLITIDTAYGSGGTNNTGKQPTMLGQEYMPKDAHEVAAKYNLLIKPEKEPEEPWIEQLWTRLLNCLDGDWDLVCANVFVDDLGRQYPWVRVESQRKAEITPDLTGSFRTYNGVGESYAFKTWRREVMASLGFVVANLKYHQWYYGSIVGDFIIQAIPLRALGIEGAGNSGEKYLIPTPKFSTKAETTGSEISNNDRFVEFENEQKVARGFYLRRQITKSWNAEIRLSDFEQHVGHSNNRTASLAFSEANAGPIKNDIEQDAPGAFEAFLVMFYQVYARLIGYSDESCKLAVGAALQGLQYRSDQFIPTAVMSYVSTARPLVFRMAELRIAEAENGLAGITKGSTLLATEMGKVRDFKSLFKKIPFTDWTQIHNLEVLYTYLEKLAEPRKAWAVEEGREPEFVNRQSGAAANEINQESVTAADARIGWGCRHCLKMGQPAGHDWKQCKKDRGVWTEKPNAEGTGNDQDNLAKKTKGQKKKIKKAAALEKKAEASETAKAVGAAANVVHTTPRENQCSNVFPGEDAKHTAFHHRFEKAYKNKFYEMKGAPTRWVGCTYHVGCGLNHPEVDQEVLKACDNKDVRNLCANWVAWKEQWKPKKDQPPCKVSVRRVGNP